LNLAEVIIYVKTFGEITSLLPDGGRRPKYVGAIFMCILM